MQGPPDHKHPQLSVPVHLLAREHSIGDDAAQSCQTHCVTLSMTLVQARAPGSDAREQAMILMKQTKFRLGHPC